MHIRVLGRGRHGGAQEVCFLQFLTRVGTLGCVFVDGSHIGVPVPHLLGIVLAL